MSKEITISVLLTAIVVILFAMLIGDVSGRNAERKIEDCINAGNKPIPCVEAVLPNQ